MSSDKKLFDRIKSEQEAFGRVTNDNLKCADCKFRFEDSKVYGNTSKCEKFKDKPNEVLLGGSCNEYRKEDVRE